MLKLFSSVQTVSKLVPNTCNIDKQTDSHFCSSYILVTISRLLSSKLPLFHFLSLSHSLSRFNSSDKFIVRRNSTIFCSHFLNDWGCNWSEVKSWGCGIIPESLSCTTLLWELGQLRIVPLNPELSEQAGNCRSSVGYFTFHRRLFFSWCEE